MRKVLFSLVAIAVTGISFAQSGQKWATVGNGISNGDFFGTTNNFPIDFRTNNISQMTLDANGNLILNKLAGSSSRILFTDAKGTISFLPAGTSGQFLQGDGTWAFLPITNKELTVDASDNIIFHNAGFIGIGTNTPKYPLDVSVDARFNGNVQFSSLAGSGDRSVTVDAGGNLRPGPPTFSTLSGGPCYLGVPTWAVGGNALNGYIPPPGADAAIGTCDNADFILKSFNNSRIWIKPNGKVGIGTATPAYDLDVNGVAAIENNLLVIGNGSLSRIYAGTQKALSAAVISSYDGFGSGGLYVETNHTGTSYNTAIAINKPNTQALTIFNTTMLTGGMFGCKEFFTVFGDGTTNIGGPITNSILAGTGTRYLYVDPNGKLIAGPSILSGGWQIGGNSLASGPGIFGTISNDHLDFITNNIPRLQIANDGHFIFGHNPGYATGNFDFNQSGSNSVLTVGSFGYSSGTNTYKSSLSLQNLAGYVELSQDGTGTGHLLWSGSNLMYFKGESILIGEPDPADHPSYGVLDINTKLTITTKTANGYTGFPFKIINPTMPNPRKTIFEVLQDGTTHVGNLLPNSPHANAKFSVDGKIACQELIVWDPVKWADFVFDENYKLPDLKEVENYYKTNKHLQGVPSEKEIMENGINSSEMDATLLQKVEELTLYLVDLNKQVQALKKENAVLKEELKK